MELSELTNNLLQSDRELVAKNNGVSVDYIYRILAGKRVVNSETTKQIISDLEFLANQNVALRIFKATELKLVNQMLAA